MFQILLVYILKINLKAITTQHHHYHHHHHYDDTLRQYDDEDDPEESEELSFELMTRRRAKHRKVADSEECYCTCDACFSREGSKPCCSEFCKYCHTDTAIPNQDQYANPEQKVVFVPFPYPLIVPNNAQNEDEQQTAAEKSQLATEKPQPEVTTSTDVTIKKPDSNVTKAGTDPDEESTSERSLKTKLRSKNIEVSMLSKHRQMKQINSASKRIRPAWVPKYGIVPIPDHLAAKLMTQLTEIRALKAKTL